MSQNELPEPKPDFSLKFWFVAIAATGIPGMIAGLTALAMVLTFVAVLMRTTALSASSMNMRHGRSLTI